MAIKIYKNEKAVDTNTFLKLEEGYDDAVSVIVCDKHGNRVSQGAVLSISAEGVLLFGSVTSDGGFKTKDGCIKLHKQ